VLDAVKVTECHITSLKSIEVVGHEVAITYNLWLLSKMNEPFDPARTGSYKTFVNDCCAHIFRNRLMRSPREPCFVVVITIISVFLSINSYDLPIT